MRSEATSRARAEGIAHTPSACEPAHLVIAILPNRSRDEHANWPGTMGETSGAENAVVTPLDGMSATTDHASS